MKIEYIEGTLYIFNSDEITPWLAQPTWPNGMAWANETEARAWGEVAVKVALDQIDVSELKDGPT